MPLTIDVMNASGKTIETFPLPEEFFGVKPHSRLVHEAVVAYQANLRRGTHSTKTRGDVSGGGIKPWKQKHTGNARAGSIRSPLWRHGGIIFGPKPHHGYFQPISRQKKRLALLAVLSDYLKQGRVQVVDSFSIAEPKTKKAAELVKKLGFPARTVLVLDRLDPLTVKAVRNLEGLCLCEASDLNSYGILLCDRLVFTKAGMEALLKRLKGEGAAAPSAN